MSWTRALSECAYVMGEMHAVREAGFTDEALRYLRSEAGLVALCAFNGIRPEQAPPGWRYWPNKGMNACWERVIDALWERAAASIDAELQAQGMEARRAETLQDGSVHDSPIAESDAPKGRVSDDE